MHTHARSVSEPTLLSLLHHTNGTILPSDPSLQSEQATWSWPVASWSAFLFSLHQVLVGSTTISGVSQYSSTINFRYKSPTISSLQNTAGADIGTSSTTEVVIVGTNFGTSAGTVYYNGEAQTSGTISTITWTNTQITLTVLGSSGSLYVKVGGEGWLA